jgi:hypothetical protein
MTDAWTTALVVLTVVPAAAQQIDKTAVDATTLRGKVMCGYQGWFRCPGDAANMGWMHWSRDPARIAPETLTFEMWPDVSEYSPDELCAAPGFTHPDGTQAYLFSSDNAATVLRHFQWMRDYGIDGAWLQRFAVGLPGGPEERWYASTLTVLDHVRHAARATGRAWAVSYDIAAMPPDLIFDAVTADWKRLVDAGIVTDERYVHEGGKPVVQMWGFYPGDAHNRITAETGRRLVDFLAAPGPYEAFFVGGGTWAWRDVEDPSWRALCRSFRAYCPWNIGNYSLDAQGRKHASMGYWDDDRKECANHGVLWIPVVYPGFSWDNLTRKPPGSSEIARRRGLFLWEQFHRLATMGVDTVYVAMFDEVDEGTAIFKVTSAPPTQAHFVGYEGLPSDWYLRLVGAGAQMLRGKRPLSADIPLEP